MRSECGKEHQDLDRIEAFVSEIVRRADGPSIVMAWNISTNESVAARKAGALSPDHFANMFDFDTTTVSKRYDWFEDLGVARDG